MTKGKYNTLTANQMKCFIIGAAVSSGILSLPNFLVEVAKQDGWISSILGGIYPFYMVLICIYISNQFPNDNILTLSKRFLGKYLGILKIQDSSKKFVEYYGKSKRKVKCSKEGDKYIFTINIDLTGDITTNQLLKDLNDNLNVKKEFENNLAQVTEKQCYEFIDKMKNVYKIDCLELGRTAASKYGRRTGVDWNEIISKSDIRVDVKVHLDKQGRGHFM